MFLIIANAICDTIARSSTHERYHIVEKTNAQSHIFQVSVVKCSLMFAHVVFNKIPLLSQKNATQERIIKANTSPNTINMPSSHFS